VMSYRRSLDRDVGTDREVGKCAVLATVMHDPRSRGNPDSDAGAASDRRHVQLLGGDVPSDHARELKRLSRSGRIGHDEASCAARSKCRGPHKQRSPVDDARLKRLLRHQSRPQLADNRTSATLLRQSGFAKVI
jgi:hypothetical protein